LDFGCPCRDTPRVLSAKNLKNHQKTEASSPPDQLLGLGAWFTLKHCLRCFWDPLPLNDCSFRFLPFCY
jgi:hypothetical protein